MTAFGKLVRTTAFRLTLVYLFLFAIFAASLLGYFAWNTRRLITEEITQTVNAETSEINEIYGRRGLRGLVLAIEYRALRPGANLYLVTTPTGQAIAGNVGSLAPGVMATRGWSETAYKRIEDADERDHRALVRVTELENGFRLLIGRDLDERRRLFGIVAKAAQWSILIVVVLGLGGGIFVARRVLTRIDAMTGTAQRIMTGDLSGRLPVGRSGDELDRLAENLNAMLERIEALMAGLKEVSDNIAHDLKTPLTRLRNRAEEALAKSGSETDYRAALERTIEESDGLIRTFNALLMIARAESGQARGNMDDFDAAEVAGGIHELYEPLAEDDGMTLKVKAEPTPVHANRELISQALANLVENAIKYGKPVAQTGGTVVSMDSRQIIIEARREETRCCSASPIVALVSPKPTASMSSSDSCGLKPAARCRAPASVSALPPRLRRCMAENCGWVMPSLASSPRWCSRRAPATGLLRQCRMCHRRWHEPLRAGKRGQDW